MNVICVKCKLEFRIVKSIFAIEMFLDPPQPYKIWNADLHECPGCHQQIVQGFGLNPIYEGHFEAVLARVQAREDTVTIYEQPQKIEKEQ